MGKATFDVSITRGADKVTITVDGDPLHMVARLRVRVNGGNEVQAIGNSIDVPAEDGAAVSASVSILDEQGNELAHRDGKATVSIRGSSHDDHVVEAPSRHVEHKLPGLVRWPTWAAITVIGGASFGYFSWQTKKDQSDLDALNASSAMHTFDEAKAIDDRGKRDSLLSNVSLGVALAAAAATVITYVIDDEVEVQPMAAPGSAGVSASIRF
jgi:hypothetical protein